MRICLDDILLEVSNYYGYPQNKILEKTRSRTPVLLRQLCCYLADKFTIHSLTEIAEYFKYEDHKSVSDNIKRIELHKETGYIRHDLCVLEYNLVNQSEISS